MNGDVKRIADACERIAEALERAHPLSDSPLSSLSSGLETHSQKPKRRKGKEESEGKGGKEVNADWMADLHRNPTYEHIDIDIELGRAQQWCAVRNKICTRRFFINWLNKIDKPVQKQSVWD